MVLPVWIRGIAGKCDMSRYHVAATRRMLVKHLAGRDRIRLSHRLYKVRHHAMIACAAHVNS